ncbi:MAG TPA: UDP-N-acetylmuramate--L-alanine ligase [bacterium]|nr:UDP-N-acetylmuramate--L-alanine ligase [bacterium]HOL46574.1 UDP-N-acetylmuramate--L-alanine ligase [bacterium]HPQ17855.1 UDP-N-acetylmuramate--L-alanine ligase [bacterium]
MFNRININKVHFVGIGGVGMSGIAEVLHNLGWKISGSDLYENDYVTHLKKIGIEIYIGHSAQNLKNVDVVVLSSAIKEDNPELIYAKKNRIPVISRAEMLAELMRLKYSIAIAGCHGKTTTTSLISLILSAAGFDPTFVVGGKINSIGSNAKLGKSDILVTEADESDGSFLKLFPIVSVITNIDNDHLDYYKTFDNIKNSFIEFANKVPFYGCVVICIEDKNATSIIKDINKKVFTYGFSENANIYAKNIVFNESSSSFDVYYFGKLLGRIKLNLPGKYNILNVLGAITVSQIFSVNFDLIKETLLTYKGVQRRFQIKCNVNNILIIDDYGHHPTEIYNTVEAARLSYPDKKIICIFQPHRYTRTLLLAKDFGRAFKYADEIIITDIYAASEKPIENVDSNLIIKYIKKSGFKNIEYISEHSEIVNYVLNNIKPNSVILTIGAGNIWKVGEIIATELMKKYK